MRINKKIFIIAFLLFLMVGSFSFLVTQSSAAPMIKEDPFLKTQTPTEAVYPVAISPTGVMGEASSMMKETATPSANNQDEQNNTVGQNLYLKFKNNQTSCQKFSTDDFEKIGQYILTEQLGNAGYMQMTQIMKDTEKQQIHIAVGKDATNCNASDIILSPTVAMMQGNKKTIVDSAVTTNPAMIGLGIGAMVAIFLNLVLTMIVLKKIGNKKTGNGSSTPPAPTHPTQQVYPVNPIVKPIFSSVTPPHPTSPIATPPQNAIPHTPMPHTLIPEHPMPIQPQEISPKPPIFSQ